MSNLSKHRIAASVRGNLSTLVLFAAVILSQAAARGQNVTLSQAPGGIPFYGTRATGFTSGYGNVNGLGIGTPATGLTVLTSGVTGGVLYTTPYNIAIAGAGNGNPAVVKVYVSANFAHPTSLILESCYPNASCSSGSNYTVISTNSATATDVIPPPGITMNQTVIASLALFVSSSGTFSGSDSATLTFLTYDGHNGHLTDTQTLTLNNPAVTVQSAVQLLLAQAPGGLAISPASDYSIDYGNVNGLGIGPGAGLSVASATGGVIYSTPYFIEPTFSGLSSSTGTVEVYVSTPFAHPAILQMEDSATGSAGSFTAISTLSGSQTSITTTANSGTNLTRYLGLFVSGANGGGAFTGTDNATLTYTLTVP